jgi:hypothetical protein
MSFAIPASFPAASIPGRDRSPKRRTLSFSDRLRTIERALTTTVKETAKT